MNSRWKNIGLWISLAALVPMVCKGFGIDILPNNYNDIVNAILGILVAAGVLSNPSIGTGYTDTTKQTTPTDITNDVKVTTPVADQAAQETTATTTDTK